MSFDHFGQMRERIRIDAQTQTVDASGNIVTAWAPQATLWAQVDRRTAQEDFRAGREEGKRNFEIIIRWIAGIGTNNRIHWRGRNFDIMGALNNDSKRQYLTLYALERNANGDDGVAGT